MVVCICDSMFPFGLLSALSHLHDVRAGMTLLHFIATGEILNYNDSLNSILLNNYIKL